MHRLRLTAFGELQRSIEESGDSLVSRMRDWEREHAYPGPQRASSPITSAGQMERASAVPSPWAFSDTGHYDDEDDIQIVSNDPVSDGISEFGSSVGDENDGEDEMDLDQPAESAPHAVGERLSSPGRSGYSAISGYTTDDESSALSFSTSSSMSSSLISLPPHQSSFAESSVPSGHIPLPKSPSNVSPSEKAIAALALVMANGAGGLNDYETVRALEAQPAALDESLIGEMWH